MPVILFEDHIRPLRPAALQRFSVVSEAPHGRSNHAILRWSCWGGASGLVSFYAANVEVVAPDSA